MAICVSANENATKEYEIPVTWQVFDKVRVQANSLEEAYEFVTDNLDTIPCGDDPVYVDSSYRISADNIEECIGYQPVNDVVCTKFTCSELKEYTDSMLFDSVEYSNESIAEATFVFGPKELTVYLEVRGEVYVTYNNEVYHKPSEFPKELREHIKAYPNNWEYTASDKISNASLYIGNNNWFEYIFDNNGEVYENDLSLATSQNILEDMTNIARQYFGIKDGE